MVVAYSRGIVEGELSPEPVNFIKKIKASTVVNKFVKALLGYWTHWGRT